MLRRGLFCLCNMNLFGSGSGAGLILIPVLSEFQEGTEDAAAKRGPQIAA